jgi:adenine phosphoribosyltransferase
MKEIFNIKEHIVTVPDYPSPGVMFRDITSLIEHPLGMKKTIEMFLDKLEGLDFDKVAGIESRGFIFATSICEKLNKGFVPIRKKGKLPRKTISQDYQLEYGTDSLEIHISSVNKGEKFILVDDLIATGGTAVASINLINQLEGNVVSCCFVIGLPDLGGIRKLETKKINIVTLCEFDGK